MTGFVYFIQVGEGGPVKIGFTTGSVERRMQNHQVGCPQPITLLGSLPGDAILEKRFHKAFQCCRERGEWFSAHPRLLAFIERAAKPVQNDEKHPLKAWRHGQQPKVTLVALAQRIGVTASHLSEVENYNNEPSLDLTSRLSDLTGLEMKAFVFPMTAKCDEAAQ